MDSEEIASVSNLGRVDGLTLWLHFRLWVENSLSLCSVVDYTVEDANLDEETDL